jgi:NADPH-dependent curcumin reductase CurA
VTARTNRQIVLTRRPAGIVDVSCFEAVDAPLPPLGPGEALMVVRYLAIDPTIRGWLDERGNYMAGVGIGECVRSSGVGVVVETNDAEKYPIGRAFTALTGWQQYRVLRADELRGARQELRHDPRRLRRHLRRLRR